MKSEKLQSFNDLLVYAMTASMAFMFAFALNFMMNRSLKWTMYLTVAPFLVYPIIKTRNFIIKIALIFGVILVVDDIFIFRNWFDEKLGGFSFNVSLILLICILAYELIFKEKVPKLDIYLLFWIIFITSAILSAYIGSFLFTKYSNEINCLQTYYLEFFGFFYLGYLAVFRKINLKLFLIALIAFGGLVAMGHFYSLYTGQSFEGIRHLSLDKGLDLTQERNWRYGSFFRNPNTMAAFYVMLIPPSVILLFSKIISKKSKLIVLVASNLMFFSLLLSGSRMGVALLGFILSLVILFHLTKIKKLFNLVVLSAAGILLFYLINFMTDDLLFRNIHKTFMRFFLQHSEDVRFQIWKTVINLSVSYPLGIGLYWENFLGLLMATKNLYFANAHNIYLSILIKTGFIGLTGFLGIFLIPFFSAVKGIFSNDKLQQPIFIALTLILLGFLMFGITEPLFTNQEKLNHIVGVVLGITFGAVRIGHRPVSVEK